MKTLIQKSVYILILFIIGVTAISCDNISEPYSEAPAIIETKRKVLLEDYTGHKCPNCPKAAKEAELIKDSLFKDQVVVMALHVSTTFASPSPGLFYYDFRTTEGTDYDNTFQISVSGLPGGMVNRIGYPTTQKMNYTSWADSVAEQLKKPAEADIEITNTYDSITRTVTASVKSKFLTAKSGTYNLCVMYVEDSIIQPQVTPTSGIDTFYVHMNALRGSFNGSLGEVIALDPEENYVKIKTYSTPLKTDAVAKNCRVVAFIYNEDTKEVIQADEKHIQ